MIPKGSLEAVNRRTHNAMATKKKQITKKKQPQKKINIGSEAVNRRRTNTMDKRKRTNSDLQNTNDGATQTLLKPRG